LHSALDNAAQFGWPGGTVLRNDRSGLDYHTLLKKAHRLVPGHGEKVRLAVLADVSTQHLLPLLRVLFADAGIDIEIYEAAYDTVHLEVYNPASGLYSFRPQIVAILQCLMKLKGWFYDFSGDRSTFSQVQADDTEGLWTAIESRSHASVIQSTFVLPCERPFGNFGLKVTDHLQYAVSELNREICVRARHQPNVLIDDIDHLAAWVGRRHFLDEKRWGLAKTLCALEFLPDVAQSIVDVALARIGRSVKCVVLDLDNTLWGGVVGDDGLEGIGLGDLDEGGAFRSFQQYLRELSRRGILLAVCSKNDEALARRVFREHPGMALKEEHIAVFVANWDDKATNLRRIQEALNIGFDSMVFLDDNPFERNLVRQLIPQIIVPELPEEPSLYVRTVSELNLFETASHSILDSQRNLLYRDQQRRQAESGRFADLNEYLQSLDTVATFQRFEQANMSRIVQLLQRSNQFNLTTRRYAESECEAMMREQDRFFPFTITLCDRFGDFGLISIVILRLDRRDRAVEIDTFLMSCRVLQRGVEEYAMNKAFEYAQRGGYERVVGRYIPTAKNGMVKNFFERFGFLPIEGSGIEGSEWSLDVRDYLPRKVFIREQPVELGVAKGQT
jgi:FkbH-like protein